MLSLFLKLWQTIYDYWSVWKELNTKTDGCCSTAREQRYNTNVDRDTPSIAHDDILQGSPEPELMPGNPEIGLHTGFPCQKNKGHKDFIPIKDFNEDHLPIGHREVWDVEIVKTLGELTVRLFVSKISPKRSKYFPQEDPSKPQTPGIRKGSGFVRYVDMYGEGGPYKYWSDKTCPCEECVDSPNPHKTWWSISIVSALHVVCDDIECNATKVMFFFDSTECLRSEKVGVRKGHKFESVGKDDFSYFNVYVHDGELKQRIENALVRFCDLISKHPRRIDDPVIIVSHPHGLSKHVTVGSWVERYDWEPLNTRFRYTAATCPGSSGGAVLSGNRSRNTKNDSFVHTFGLSPHSEGMPDGTNRSSGEWWWSLLKE